MNRKSIERQAKVAVTNVKETTGEVKVEYVLRDVSRLAPLENV